VNFEILNKIMAIKFVAMYNPYILIIVGLKTKFDIGINITGTRLLTL